MSNVLKLIVLTEEARAKFLALVDARGPDECWPWAGTINTNGYGHFSAGSRGQTHIASRVAWFLANGRQPQESVCHSCDNPPCCNPAHLWVGTHDQNMKDMQRKARHSRRRQTHCCRGHEFTPENTRHRKGSRFCIECIRLRNAARPKRNAA